MKKYLSIILFFLLSLSGYSQRHLVGLSPKGGKNLLGTIFETDSDGTNAHSIYDFELQNPGRNPNGNLFLANNHKFYGLTEGGGKYDLGILFEYDPQNKNYKVLIDFDGSVTGQNPRGSLMQANDGKLYGMTYSGGSQNYGTLFEYDLISNIFSVLFNFGIDNKGGNPKGSLIQAKDGKLYGIAGIIFNYDISSHILTRLFPSQTSNGQKIGSNACGSLLQASNGKMYGLCSEGGKYDAGTLFEFNPLDSSGKILADFEFSDTVGYHPYGSVIQASNGKLYGMVSNDIKRAAGGIFEYDLLSSQFQMIYNFKGDMYEPRDTNSIGAPFGDLLEGPDGKLYGMTRGGGGETGIINGSPDFNLFNGILFSYDINQKKFQQLRRLGKTHHEGTNPRGNLVLGENGNLYGMTRYGGIYEQGTIFSFDYNKLILNTEVEFNVPTQGQFPKGDLLKANNGKLYGTTMRGGTEGYGILFSLDSNAQNYTVLNKEDTISKWRYPIGSLYQKSASSLMGISDFNNEDNYSIYTYDINQQRFRKELDFKKYFDTGSGRLISGNNEKLYGLSSFSDYSGFIFEYNPQIDSITEKIQFTNGNGARPEGSLLLANNGKMYGFTSRGGAYNEGVLFEYDYQQNNIKILISFLDSVTGASPTGSLIQAKNGKLYGSTYFGVLGYDLNTSQYHLTYFNSNSDGYNPDGTLLEASDGKLYGVTTQGGKYNQGALFQYDIEKDTIIAKSAFDGTNGSNPVGQLVEIGHSKKSMGIKKTFPAQALRVVPNPFSKVIQVNGLPEKTQVVLLNNLGQIVYKHEIVNLSSFFIDTEHLLSGVYFLQVETPQSKEVFKVIKIE